MIIRKAAGKMPLAFGRKYNKTKKTGEKTMYSADKNRYSDMTYKPSGLSGLKLPRVSLGLWHNFGFDSDYSNMKKMLFTAFDLGITHFDLANNYGRPHCGSAEINFGKILKENMQSYRDEMIISTKAGYYMWEGPYGEWGSRKYLIASLDRSLCRMGLDYVDIFYHHRPDPETPLEETMCALDQIVRSGKALYVGLSNYDGERMKAASAILRELHCPFVINQNRYSIFDRTIENNGLIETSKEEGRGIIAFSPLAQGLLTDRYLKGIPEDSRVRTSGIFLKEEHITEEKLSKVRSLAAIAEGRGETLSQMALGWVLANPAVTSVLIGASRPEQIKENVAAHTHTSFTEEELELIDRIALG